MSHESEKCAVCRKAIMDDDQTCEVLDDAGDHVMAHEECADGLRTCEACSMPTQSYERTPTDYGTRVDLCVTCYENNTFHCDDCGETIYGSPYEDDCCESCCESRRDWEADRTTGGLQFHDVATKRVATRRDPKPLTPYLGVELEYEFNTYSARKEVAELLPLHWYCYHDGSLSETGGEFCSPPATLKAWRRMRAEWGRFLRAMERNGSTNDGTGLHISISRTAFADEEHVMRFLLMVYRHPTLSVEVAERDVRHNRWCSLYDSGERTRGRPAIDYVRRKAASQYGEKYSAVNVESHRLEVRMFKAPSSTKKLFAKLCYVHALHEYTLKYRDLKYMRATLFRQYVQRHKRRYAELAEVLSHA